MTTTKAKSDTPSPEEAEAQLRDSEDHYHDLEERLTAGDMSVRQSDISSARSQVEYMEKVLKGAEATAFREAKADREERGHQLHRRFVADTSKLVTQTNQSLIEVGMALSVALDDLDQMKDLKDAYQKKVNEIFGGDMENPVALLFKRGHHSAGSFGALDEFHVLPRPNPVMTLLAVFGETLRGHDRTLSGPDQGWAGQLKQGPLANDLRDIRALGEYLGTFQTQEEDKE